MASIDEQIQLAEQIAKQLSEVTRNEWMRWMQVANQHGITYAIRYAERLSTDPTMRPTIQRANQQIAQVLKKYTDSLNRYSIDNQRVALGYVAWWRRVLEKKRMGNRNQKRRK